LSLNIQDCINFWKDIFDLVSETSISSNLDTDDDDIRSFNPIDTEINDEPNLNDLYCNYPTDDFYDKDEILDDQHYNKEEDNDEKTK